MESKQKRLCNIYAFSGNLNAPKSTFSHPVFSGGGIKTPHF